MKPTRTAHVLRNILHALDSELKVCPNGYLMDEAIMPTPTEFKTPKEFAKAYLAYNIARKRESSSATPLAMRNALTKWATSEFRCHTVNQYDGWVFPICPNKRSLYRSLNQRIRAIISDILSDIWPEFVFEPTAGATSTTMKKYSWGCTKVDGMPLFPDAVAEPHKCAPMSEDLLVEMFLQNPGVAARYMRARYALQIDMPLTPDEVQEAIPDLAAWLCENVPPAMLDYVPKERNEVRIIGKSNSLTIMIQKIFGNAIRQALFDKVGVNLNDQSINQEWAEIGSFTGLIATVDLSAASDSISLSMLKLFPLRWQQYFIACRDEVVCPKGATEHRLNMVAGMGNGYIFELESLLFYAMSRACVEELGLETSWVTVYGDDIIVPAPVVPLLEEFFLSHGFLLNMKKSFAAGPFRESCGKHYFNGVDVSPVFVKGDLNELVDLYHLYNGLCEWSNRTGVDITKAIDYIYRMIPEKDRCFVPVSWGTKAGINYPRADTLMPRHEWVKRWQRYRTSFSYVALCTYDVTERLPIGAQLCNWFIGAQCAEPVLPPDIWSKLFTHPHAHHLRNTIGAFGLTCVGAGRVQRLALREAVRASVVSEYEKSVYRRKTKRDASLAGDV